MAGLLLLGVVAAAGWLAYLLGLFSYDMQLTYRSGFLGMVAVAAILLGAAFAPFVWLAFWLIDDLRARRRATIAWAVLAVCLFAGGVTGSTMGSQDSDLPERLAYAV